MANKNSPEENREVSEGKNGYVRVIQRDKAVERLALGMTVKDTAKEICSSIKSVYKWLKEPEFKRKLDAAREIIAMDAINGAAGLIGEATQTLMEALKERDNPKLALDLLDKLGVLRTTGNKIGMDADKSDGSNTPVITINISGAGIETDSTIIDAESTVIESDSSPDVHDSVKE